MIYRESFSVVVRSLSYYAPGTRVPFCGEVVAWMEDDLLFFARYGGTEQWAFTVSEGEGLDILLSSTFDKAEFRLIKPGQPSPDLLEEFVRTYGDHCYPPAVDYCRLPIRTSVGKVDGRGSEGNRLLLTDGSVAEHGRTNGMEHLVVRGWTYAVLMHQAGKGEAPVVKSLMLSSEARFPAVVERMIRKHARWNAMVGALGNAGVGQLRRGAQAFLWLASRFDIERSRHDAVTQSWRNLLGSNSIWDLTRTGHPSSATEAAIGSLIRATFDPACLPDLDQFPTLKRYAEQAWEFDAARM